MVRIIRSCQERICLIASTIRMSGRIYTADLNLNSISILLFYLCISMIVRVELFASAKVDQAAKEYRNDMEQARKQVLKVFEAELKKALNEKDLESANAIKKQMEEWRDEELGKIPKVEENSEQVAEKDSKSKDAPERKLSVLEKELLESSWRVQVENGYGYSSSQVQFNRDGTVNVYTFDGGNKFCYWKVKGNMMGLFTKGKNDGMDLWSTFVYLPSNKSWLSTKPLVHNDKLRFRPF